MKNGLIIFLIILIIGGTGFGIYYEIKIFNEKYGPKEPVVTTPNNNVDNTDYSVDVTEEQVKEILGNFPALLQNKSYTVIDDHLITEYLAHLILNDQIKTKEEVTKFIQEHFGKSFELKEGIYTSSNQETYEIKFENDTYSTTLKPSGKMATNHFKSIEKKKNQIIAIYTYGNVVDQPNEVEEIGTTKIYLNYQDKNWVITKTEYQEKKEQ